MLVLISTIKVVRTLFLNKCNICVVYLLNVIFSLNIYYDLIVTLILKCNKIIFILSV